MKFHHCVLPLALAALAAPADATIVINAVLDLKPAMVVNFSGQRLVQTISFAPVTFGRQSQFEFNLSFKPGQSIVMTDDLAYPAVRPEMITLDMEFADRRQRTVSYRMTAQGVKGSYNGAYEATQLATRSTGPNLTNDYPFDLTGSSFSFTGMRWTGMFGSDPTPITLSSVNIEITADRLAVAIAPPAVPEPATWAMLALGFGIVGSAARRRPRLAHA